jgi:hypothetical protein
MRAPFWWPIDIGFIRKLYFGEIVVMTIYNPAHLLKRIRLLGFEVSKQKTYKIERKIGYDRKIELCDTSWFIKAVSSYLLKEEKAMEFIPHLIQKIENNQIPPSSRIDIDVACISM